MKEIIRKLIYKIISVNEKLKISLYQGEKLENNLKQLRMGALILFVVSSIMTTLNIVRRYDMMALSTGILAVAMICCYYILKFTKKRKLIEMILWILFAVIFSLYTVKGSNNGFAILWTLLVPMFYMYFLDVRSGIVLCLYFWLLILALFLTPLRSYVTGYSDTFMERFPVLYGCAFILMSLMNISRHMNILFQQSINDDLIEAVKAEHERTLSTEAKKNEIQQNYEIKTQILEKLSHSIRSPINGIVGMNEMILKEAKDEKILEYSENVDESVKKLLVILDEILIDYKKEAEKNFLQRMEYEQSNEFKVKDLSGMKILGVDDDEINRKVLNEYLKETGCELSIAMSGREAIEKTRQNKYDVILMDHMMPDINGVEAVKIIRDDESNKSTDTVIIALTANATLGARQYYESKGFDDYISKPVKFNYLIQQIYKYKGKKRRDIIVNENQNSIIREKGLESCLGDIELYNELLSTFYRQGPENIEKLNKYVLDENYEDYRTLVHALKNNARTIGALDFSLLSKKHEYAVRDDNLIIIKEGIDDYINEYERLLYEVGIVLFS